MKSKFNMNTVAAAVLAVTSIGVSASEASEGAKTTVDLSFRYRIESVDHDSFTENAIASTLKSRATVKTKWNETVSTIIEFDDVSVVGTEDYNPYPGTIQNNNPKTSYPVVADPEGTEVNQAYLKVKGDDYNLGIGRQRILLGNQRLVGGVGWRQNEQTYDAVTFKKNFDDLSINYAYIDRVNRIFGEKVGAGDHRHNTHLLNADYKLSFGKLSAYYLSIDNDNSSRFSNNTLGARLNGKNGNFNYTVEYAKQTENTERAREYDANYYLLEGVYKQDNFSVGAGIELLGGDSANERAFTTSLATLHKFQGWADVFLATPNTGINDKYLSSSYNLNGFKFKFVYHDFTSDEGSVDFGSEIDISMAKKVNKNWSTLVKYANFDSDNEMLYPSVNKVWLMVTFKP